MEVGGRGRQEEFWNEYDEATVNAFRRFAVLHYELFPYFEEMARRAAATGVPILRPLGFSFPRDEEAWGHDLELMVGPDILAAPVVGEEAELGDPAGATPARVYLPQGSWIDLFTGETITGARTIVRPTPITEMPLYLRSGAVIPFNLRESDVWSKRWHVADLNRPGRAGWMYAPATRATTATTHAAGVFRARPSGRAQHIFLEDAPPEVQVLVLTRSAPRFVAIDGRRVGQAPSVGALRRMRQGWMVSHGAFGGIVIKLAPHAGRSLIDFALE
jgi:alpha-D-xyloside xylohydrolase